ncbi:uncharacterized protein METZ01_LOCUS501187 [marine metagenome]|uniref:ABM domain-containing protein n=1 Tax=marine metagenome TaxID=408172 RepID=A0A383DVR0_9ZZZZ
MITLIVTFKLPEDLSRSELKSMYLENAKMYQETPGLVRKNYLYDPEKNLGGGCYIFKSRTDADAWFDDKRIAWLTERYSTPTLKYFESPLVVNNENNKIEENDFG